MGRLRFKKRLMQLWRNRQAKFIGIDGVKRCIGHPSTVEMKVLNIFGLKWLLIKKQNPAVSAKRYPMV